MSITRNPVVFKKPEIECEKKVALPKNANYKTAPVHMTSPQKVTLNKNFLLALINPTDDFSIQERTFTNGAGFVKLSVLSPEIQVLSERAKKYLFEKNDEEIYNWKHLPTLSEFKILLSLLHYAQQKNAVVIEFNSISHMLNLVGLSHTSYNHNQLISSLFNFAHLVMSYHDSYMEYPNPDKPCGQIVRRVKVSNFFVFREIGMDLNNLTIKFDANFLTECKRSLMQDLHIEKINKINSPKTMQLYLWLLGWSYRRNDKNVLIFNRFLPVDTDFLFTEIGWKKPDEGSQYLRPSRMLEQVNKCLDEIKEIDPGFKDFRVTLEENKTKFFFENFKALEA